MPWTYSNSRTTLTVKGSCIPWKFLKQYVFHLKLFISSLGAFTFTDRPWWSNAEQTRGTTPIIRERILKNEMTVKIQGTKRGRFTAHGTIFRGLCFFFIHRTGLSDVCGVRSTGHYSCRMQEKLRMDVYPFANDVSVFGDRVRV